MSEHRDKFPIWILPLIIAVLVAMLGWWGNDLLRQTIQDQLRAQLTATLNANVTALGIWSTNQTRLATALAEEPEVRSLAARVFQAAATGRRNGQEFNRFANEFRPRLTQLGYEVADLVSPDFKIVANSIGMPLPINFEVSDAHTNQFSDLFIFGEPVIITPFKPSTMLPARGGGRNGGGLRRTNELRRLNRLTPTNFGNPRRGDVTLMQVAAPVRDPAEKVIGALALIINPDQEFSRILSVARAGVSGETYAFDQTGLLISHSRFDLQLKQLGLLNVTNVSSALNLRLHDPGGDLTHGFQPTNSDAATRPLIRLIASAVDGEDVTLLHPTRDYRGVLIVGAACWLPDFGFGVATQMDADEAFRPLHVLQMVFIVLVLFLLLCATGMFLISNLTWRRRLSEAELKLKQLGQYTLEEKIGEGGMGVVYRARHALLRRDTAVKLLLPDRADAAAIARFEKEVCLTCQLTHPNTIQVYDYGHTPDGIFYYAMEFLRGLNLHDLVARCGPLPESRVVHILAQVCDSLAEAHALGLIHRDIKPGNIFLCHRGGVADCVKVLDFGLVREFRRDETEPVTTAEDNVIEGTPWFTPPEAIQGSAAIGPGSDLYSLAALGYFLLTGHYIFDAESIAEIHEKQLNSSPVPPSQRTAQPISAELETLLLDCLEKEVELRPPSANALKKLLLATPMAADWTPELRALWWDKFDSQPPPTVDETAADPSPPLATVRIDLDTRME